MIIYHTVPETWHVTDVIVIFYFGLFFALLPYPFTLFTLPFTPTAQDFKFKKMEKKPPRDIMILHMCTKNYDHKIECSWYRACDRCNCCFSFWVVYPFPSSLTAWKIQLWNEKKLCKLWLKQHSNLLKLLEMALLFGSDKWYG